jgi:WD and tetratricopeptide repeat-containing protein 1
MRFDNSFAVNSDAYSLPEGCVQCFVAAHLPQKSLDLKKRFRGLAATYVTFSPNGAELLANIGGEQIYLFDINKRRRMQKFNIGLSTAKNGIGSLANGISNNLAVASGDCALSANTGEGSSKTVTLPTHVDALKKEANKCFEKQDYRRAVVLYNVAIAQCPSAALLYSNRAAALIKRNWYVFVVLLRHDIRTVSQLAIYSMVLEFIVFSWKFQSLGFFKMAKLKHKYSSDVNIHALLLFML